MVGAAIGGELLLEPLVLCPKNIPTARNDARAGVGQFILQGVVLAQQIVKRNDLTHIARNSAVATRTTICGRTLHKNA